MFILLSFGFYVGTYVSALSHKKLENFEFSISEATVQLMPGQTKKVIGTIKNYGDADLTLFTQVKIEKDCCLVDVKRMYNVPSKAEFDFPISISVKKQTEVSEYLNCFNYKP